MDNREMLTLLFCAEMQGGAVHDCGPIGIMHDIIEATIDCDIDTPKPTPLATDLEDAIQHIIRSVNWTHTDEDAINTIRAALEAKRVEVPSGIATGIRVFLNGSTPDVMHCQKIRRWLDEQEAGE